MSSKRPRSSSPLSTRSSSPSHESMSEPAFKIKRVIPDSLYTSLTCALPPTCSAPHKPTKLSSIQDVEEHYAKYHTHVCESKGCRTVFPDERLLELHFAECHDPILALKRDRGEKTFSCFISSCDRLFMTPKGRRLHLIQVHNYPKQYFFAVTNKGIGGLLHKWGQGASLIRGDWKPRTKDEEMPDGSNEDSESGSIDESTQTGLSQPNGHAGGDTYMPNHSSAIEMDSLSGAMSSLSLVPDKIRFGRGGKKGGFSHFQHPKPHRRYSLEHTEANGKRNGFRHSKERRPKEHVHDSARQRMSSAEADSTNSGEVEVTTMSS